MRGDSGINNLCELIILSKVCNALGSGANKVVDLELRDSARVRIINFKTPTEPQFEVDICFNNVVALENTSLLKTYTMIDERVCRLGIIVKLWARAFDICNPRNGTLSPYAYNILVINFLQKVSTPILPVLQENCENKNIIEGVDCSFDSDFEKYRPLAQANTDSDGILLYRFFRFYSFFDWRVNTVDIRFKHYPPKKNSELLISIQDPFEVNRNLGDVVKNTEASERIINTFKFALKEVSLGKPLANILGMN